jgi:hypothetical protein
MFTSFNAHYAGMASVNQEASMRCDYVEQEPAFGGEV